MHFYIQCMQIAPLQQNKCTLTPKEVATDSLNLHYPYSKDFKL